jgi:hypothetical protein
MKVNLSEPVIRRVLTKFKNAGAKSNCPFCKGRMIASVSPGERIILLQGMYTGLRATVSDQPGWSEDEFLVHFDNDAEDTLTRVGYKRDKFAYFPIARIPDWLCHLSIDDLSAIEEIFTSHYTKFFDHSKKEELVQCIVATDRNRAQQTTSSLKHRHLADSHRTWLSARAQSKFL